MVYDPDNAYPTGFTLTILPGTNYTFAGTTVTPNPNVSGLIEVRVKVNDGSVDSAPYPLKIDVNSVNDAPVITGQLPMTTLEDTPINMSMGFLIISDPDSHDFRIYHGNFPWRQLHINGRGDKASSLTLMERFPFL